MKNTKLFLRTIVALSVLVTQISALAANFTWSPAGIDTNWSTAANWFPSALPTSGGTAVFNTNGLTVGNINNVADQNFVLDGIIY